MTYNKTTLKRVAATIRDTKQKLAADPTTPTETLDDLDLAAEFIQDTAAVLDLQQKGQRDRAAKAIIESRRRRRQQGKRRRK